MKNTTTYSVTGNGNYQQIISDGKGTTVIKTTPFADRFMKWLTAGEVMDEQQKIDHLKRTAFWELSTGHYLRGSFNGEHYQRVLAAREAAGIPEVFIHPAKVIH